MLECLMIKTQPYIEFKSAAGSLRFSRSCVNCLPPIERFIEECVTEIDTPVSRPGCVQTPVVIDERKIMKSWWKCDALRLFISPSSVPSDFCRKRVDSIRRSKKPLSYSLNVEKQKLQSADGFFSTALNKTSIADEDSQPGPPRVKGKMIWSHKTAPELEIEGKGSPLDPEYIAAQRRR